MHLIQVAKNIKEENPGLTIQLSNQRIDLEYTSPKTGITYPRIIEGEVTQERIEKCARNLVNYANSDANDVPRTVRANPSALWKRNEIK